MKLGSGLLFALILLSYLRMRWRINEDYSGKRA